MTLDALFDFYLDAQILLILAACLWGAAVFILKRTPLGRAQTLRLQLAYGTLSAAALAPFAIGAVGAARTRGWIAPETAPNLEELVLAQFLDGRIQMSPLQFEAILNLRGQFVQDVIAMNGMLMQGLVWILAIGTLAALARVARDALRLGSLVRGAFLWRRIGRVDIRISDRIAVPFSTRGWRRHYVVLPQAMLLHTRDTRIAVAHEIQHMRQRDTSWEILLELMRPLFFWNPAFIILKREIETQRELACDQNILGRQVYGLRDYADCLLRVCESAIGRGQRTLSSSVPFVQVGSTPRGIRSANFLQARVGAMLAGGRRAGGAAQAVLVLPVAGLMLLGAVALQPSTDWTQDRLMLSSIVNLERLDMRNGLSVPGN